MAPRMVAAPRISRTQGEKVALRQAVRSGSPFRCGDVLTDPDPAHTEVCTTCGSRFLSVGGKTAEQHLAVHAGTHDTRPRTDIEAEVIAVAAEQAAARIAGLEPGTPINQLQIAEWCSITRKQASTLFQQLTDRGVLRRRASGSGGYHRVEVA